MVYDHVIFFTNRDDDATPEERLAARKVQALRGAPLKLEDPSSKLSNVDRNIEGVTDPTTINKQFKIASIETGGMITIALQIVERPDNNDFFLILGEE